MHVNLLGSNSSKSRSASPHDKYINVTNYGNQQEVDT